MDTIKDRNGTDLTEAEDIKKRWQENTELHTHTHTHTKLRISMTKITTMI